VTLLSWSGEGVLPLGTTLAIGNMGNPSGPAPSLVTIGAGCGQVSDNAHVGHGRTAVKYTVPGGSSLNNYDTWLLPTTQATVAARGYFYTPSNTATVGMKCIGFSSGASSPCCYVGWSATGQLIVANGAATAVGTGAGPAVPASTLCRFEIQVTAMGTAGGAATVAYYLGDSLTAQDTASCTGQNFVNTTADRVRFGTASANTNALTFWGDCYAWQDTSGVIGPGALPYVRYIWNGTLWLPATVTIF
jgi:hypothetical protein